MKITSLQRKKVINVDSTQPISGSVLYVETPAGTRAEAFFWTTSGQIGITLSVQDPPTKSKRRATGAK